MDIQTGKVSCLKQGASKWKRHDLNPDLAIKLFPFLKHDVAPQIYGTYVFSIPFCF